MPDNLNPDHRIDVLAAEALSAPLTERWAMRVSGPWREWLQAFAEISEQEASEIVRAAVVEHITRQLHAGQAQRILEQRRAAVNAALARLTGTDTEPYDA